MRILLIEDDPGIAEPLVDGLTAKGFVVDWVPRGEDALGGANTTADVVLLDLTLPGLDGVAVCRELRAAAPLLPIIVITARGEEDDRVAGLDAGADDYLVKPFGFRELVARIQAVNRRLEAAMGLTPQAVQELGRLVLDRRTRRVLVDGQEVALTPKEFDLLAALAEDPGAVISRQAVFDEVWDPHWYGPTKTLDVHVASLRRKLSHPEWIETIRGVGLRLTAGTTSPT